jgi:peptide/nickel transport system substrate-binding protein
MNKTLTPPALAVLITLIMISSLTACGAPPASATPEAQVTDNLAATAVQPATSQPTGPKVLTVRLVNDISNLDPAYRPSTAEDETLLCIMQGLVAYKPGTTEVVNVLAESVTPSADGLRIDFKLKEGVQFQGGFGEVTAEDVKFSYERYIDPALDVPEKVNWSQLDKVEVTGRYTGTIVMKGRFAPLWVNTLPYMAGVVMSKVYVEQNGAEAYAKRPIGTGPYEFVEWVPDQYLLLKRFAGYVGAPPEWDEIRFIPVIDDSAAEIALETGELDFAPIPETMVERFEAKSDFDVVKIVPFSYDGLLMNVQHPNLMDLNVRQAIRYAIDVPAIIEVAYGGLATRACAILAPGQLGFWEQAPCYERDVVKAKEYLAKASAAPQGLTITTLNGEKDRQVGELIQANLAEVGIQAEVIAQDDATYWDGGFGEPGLKERQLTYIRWSSTGTDPSYNTSWFTCEQVLQWNWMYACSPEFDRLHLGALEEMDQVTRAEMYVELQRVWDEGVNVVWTVHPADFFAVRSDIHAVLTPLAIPVPWAFTAK